jgi:hypothetical protein
MNCLLQKIQAIQYDLYLEPLWNVLFKEIYIYTINDI